MMQMRGIHSMKELIGRALPNPIVGFLELTAEKQVSTLSREVCIHCGNCTRCPYLAIEFDSKKVPVMDPASCIGCSICVQKCFSGALYMRKRTKRELMLLKED